MLALMLMACRTPEPAEPPPAPVPDARALAMVPVFTEDNADWADRAAVAAKYEAMAADPYDFFRGSYRWFTEAYPRPWDPTGDVALIGDPHPENIATVRFTETVGLAFVDLDAATVGDPRDDLRRLALGAAVLVHPLPDCACTSDVLRAVHQGYADAVTGQPQAWAPFLTELIAEAEEEGSAGQRLGRVAEGLPRDASHTEADVAFVQAIVAAAHPDWTVTDAVARHGKGVSSRPAPRFDVVVSPPRLLDVRQLARAPQPVGPRWVAHDDVYAEVTVGEHAWRIRDRTSYSQAVAVEDVHGEWLSGDLDREDIVALGTSFGRILGEAHHRGGLTELPVDAETIIAVGGHDLTALHADHARFHDLLLTGALTAGTRRDDP